MAASVYFRVALVLSTGVSTVCQSADYTAETEQYLGAGLSRIAIKSGHPSIADQSITGVALAWGIRRYNHVFELALGGGGGVNVGPTYDIYYPEDKADYGYFSLSYHYQFRSWPTQGSVVPFLGAGYSFNSINWQSYVYDHSGEGYAITAGAIFPVDEHWSLNASFAHHNFSGSRILFSSSDYEEYTTRVNLITINVVYHFLGHSNFF